LKDAEGGKKRKRAEASDKLTGISKRGGRGHGRAWGLKVDRVAAAKVSASSAVSSVAMARPGSVVLLASLPGRKMPNISSLPLLQEISDDVEDEEEEEKEGSDGSEEVQVDGSCSSSIVVVGLA
jgi:hypothetical protein